MKSWLRMCVSVCQREMSPYKRDEERERGR